MCESNGAVIIYSENVDEIRHERLQWMTDDSVDIWLTKMHFRPCVMHVVISSSQCE